ncbi:MAG: Pseudouridine synthase [Candidatus Falkowbacteria bacterium GW2011_GWC2_38_22]|uniref:Pseudouridine synthase n=1 Tax=Candidatus Falkowbacteria bacterium GW2011_GWE1_38_31 TaxID=1618638 RepID=A0A0G0JS47_9BACT|nr:MAG: Pseudouridine synthase [Candidatus Falkowbacteria bacterium GW2011_GWF2_38_1205]KKQ60503.1 MAG: Pseudouridine synthase [Candidatus Falkowbacteria bacterium GW2011_GWC2_38_22]KKQ62601.1 MAG: Pseudouridine synthase [Candidatus Falkowbacteria bacterium GW2011_GWF1_38_22]KKQ64648.1 MAG: Pseudouridine synthase [Candidatus Falkowbacteria bacterium GW2011_GWE2_38_254]KKQ69557.1 MAG: Pseudouridine synthase [Candidatus Falkowbacteria bacterium GW2011_GWE1_38_31]KKQ71910.1 MAG: Pseudouridine syn
MKYELIDKTEDYLVINKPAGLLTHGAKHIDETSLTDLLLADYPEIAKVGEDESRPGIMHRLDKLASGLIVIARNDEGYADLKKQFQERAISKCYTALAYGKVEKDEDEINFPIERSAKGHKMAALPITIKGKPSFDGRHAITRFEVLKRYINYTLLKVKIETGRTHQIRCHFSAYGCPLVGDDLYATKKTKLKNAKLNLGRIFLVADNLEFTDLNGERKKYSIELPEELKTFLEKIH